MTKRHKDMSKLQKVTAMIINEQPLPPERKNHPLYGNWIGSFECHVEPNWLLIYAVNPATNEVTFHRTGSHADLF